MSKPKANKTALNTLETLARADPDYHQTADSLTELTTLLKNDQSAEQKLNDIATETLDYLKQQDPQRAQAIDALSAQTATAQTKSFELVTTAAVFTAIAVLLRTHVKIKKDAKGNWTFVLEHKPIQSKLLSSILKKLNGLV
ncbi:MAG: hypothetical protein MJK04_23570 [Psychrosphaera sp.]|nr:hypothetical protein [Psychrosphaera sp.]